MSLLCRTKIPLHVVCACFAKSARAGRGNKTAYIEQQFVKKNKKKNYRIGVVVPKSYKPRSSVLWKVRILCIVCPAPTQLQQKTTDNERFEWRLHILLESAWGFPWIQIWVIALRSVELCSLIDGQVQRWLRMQYSYQAVARQHSNIALNKMLHD